MFQFQTRINLKLLTLSSLKLANEIHWLAFITRNTEGFACTTAYKRHTWTYWSVFVTEVPRSRSLVWAVLLLLLQLGKQYSCWSRKTVTEMLVTPVWTWMCCLRIFPNAEWLTSCCFETWQRCNNRNRLEGWMRSIAGLWCSYNYGVFFFCYTTI